jgi:DNA-binding LacI/PurR family transcriptional regulator
MKHGASIHDVARAAGVSVTTVSHALNDKGRIAQATRDRIREVVAQLDYRPHAGARSLAGGRTGILGVCVAQAEDLSFAVGGFAYFMQLMGAATQAALARGFALVLVPMQPGQDPFAHVDVDGAVIIDPVAHDPVVSRLRERGVAVVTTGRVPGDDDEDALWVDNNHRAGAGVMLRHLERAGARRIAHISTAPVTSFTLDCLEVYEAWARDHDMTPQVAVARGSGLTEPAGLAAAEQLLDRRDPPDAIFATLDRLGLGVLRAAERRGMSVPDDLLVASYTDSDAARWTRPSLTAMRLDPDTIGRVAIDLLVQTIEGEPSEQHVVVPTRLLPRASTRVRHAQHA